MTRRLLCFYLNNPNSTYSFVRLKHFHLHGRTMREKKKKTTRKFREQCIANANIEDETCAKGAGGRLGGAAVTIITTTMSINNNSNNCIWQTEAQTGTNANIHTHTARVCMCKCVFIYSIKYASEWVSVWVNVCCIYIPQHVLLYFRHKFVKKKKIKKTNKSWRTPIRTHGNENTLANKYIFNVVLC